MHRRMPRFARAAFVLSAALVLALPMVPAVADGDDDHEAEVAGLELKAAPAVVKVDHPVLIKARFEVDELNDDCAPTEDPSENPTEEPTEHDDSDVETLSEHDDDELDDDESDDDDDSDDDSDEDADEDDSDEDESDDDCDDSAEDDADDSDDSDDDADDESDEDSDDDADDDSDLETLASDDDGCAQDEDDDADDSDDDSDDGSDDDQSDDDSEVETLAQGQGRGRDGDACTTVTFKVDFGDGSPVEQMTAKGRHKVDKAKAHARHSYAAEGDYEVTVTATPEGGETITASITVQVGKGGARLSGRDRFETGTELSEEAFPEDGSASAAVLARADGFADALASATLAALEDAPVLLTSTDQLPDSVLAELQRVLAPGGTVYVLGGTAAISDDVVATLEGLGYAVERISGEDRIDTALAVAQTLVDSGEEIDEVVLANAGNFPDALSGAASAADRGAPVLLTPATVLDPRVREFLAGLPDGTKVLVAGGPKVVTDEVIAELEALGMDVERRSGKDRFATSAVIAAEEFPDATSVVIATGKTFPDALSGAAHAGRIAAPVLLVGDTLPDEVRAYLEAGAGRINLVYVIGGPNAVSAEVMAEIESILGL